jgi:hypothetical protein
LGGLAPPLPPPEAEGGLTPPVPGSTPPPVPPWLPPVPPVPAEGVCGVGAGAGVGAGVAVPPLEPVPGVEVPELPELRFFFEVEGVVTPPVTGVVDGWNVGTGAGFEPPPLDAIATTTIRKKITPASATSLRRR